jgi:hypothetical protein
MFLVGTLLRTRDALVPAEHEQLVPGARKFASAAFAQCTDTGTPHAITGNLAVELYGPVDTWQTTYGHADYVVWSQTFTNVPAGCRVQILHISGDFIAWAMGAVPASRLTRMWSRGISLRTTFRIGRRLSFSTPPA